MPEQLKTNVLYNSKGQAVYLEDKEVADKISTEGVEDFAELIDSKVDKVEGKGLSSNDFTDAEKVKLAALGNYDDSALTAALSNKVDKVSGKGLSTEDFTTAEKQKLTTVYTSQEVDALLANKVSTSVVGEAGGVASLGNDGKVPSSQLPSYVDDVIEFANRSAFPAEGEAGKIYVALNTDKTYRWSGSEYVQIKGDIVIGTEAGTAYDGASGAANASAISDIQGVIPSNATTSNKLATQADIPDVSGLASASDIPDVSNFITSDDLPTPYDDTALAGRVSDIEDVIPSTATSSNKLATVADIPSQQTITVDSALDGTSTNPVQNKVVKETIDSLDNKYIVNAAEIPDFLIGTKFSSNFDVYNIEGIEQVYNIGDTIDINLNDKYLNYNLRLYTFACIKIEFFNGNTKVNTGDLGDLAPYEITANFYVTVNNNERLISSYEIGNYCNVSYDGYKKPGSSYRDYEINNGVTFICRDYDSTLYIIYGGFDNPSTNEEWNDLNKSFRLTLQYNNSDLIFDKIKFTFNSLGTYHECDDYETARSNYITRYCIAGEVASNNKLQTESGVYQLINEQTGDYDTRISNLEFAIPQSVIDQDASLITSDSDILCHIADDGNYVLKCTVSGGVPTYTWVPET